MIPFTSFKNKKIVLITHVGADTDAIASVGALALFLSRKNSVQIAIPEHISANAKSLARKSGVEYSISPSLGKADCIIMVDFNSWEMLGEMGQKVKDFKGEKFLLDHHTKSKQKIAPEKNSWVEEGAVASAMLVYKWFKKSNIPIDKKTASLIAAGITADSANFLIADAETFSVMAEMLKKSGKKFSEIISLLRVERDFSEKIAMLKAAKRSRLFKLGNYIVAISDVGAFEADSATALIKLGADLSFAGDAEKGKIRISGRASQKILKESGIDLAKHVFQPLCNHFKGDGGGHPGAAGFNGEGNEVEKALLKCVSLSHQFLKKNNQKIQLKEYT